MVCRLLPFLLLGLLLISSTGADASKAPAIFWPTPNAQFFEGGSIEDLLQPTASGKMESALFGCVRENGRRYHEGLDLAPMNRNKHGEATDSIFAVMAGRVVYVNTKAGNSSYGRYVVIEHEGADVSVYTLYSHLAKVDRHIQEGRLVKGGERIGTMGRSAGGYSIPRSRAHLHFEMGLRKSSDFDDWHRWRKLSGKNLHGNYNGLNLTGFDPVDFFSRVRVGELTDFESYIKNLPTAFTLRISTRRVPDFIRRYPRLLTLPLEPSKVVAWQIEFTWYGLPKKWAPLQAHEVPTSREGDIALLSYDKEAFAGHCRSTLTFKKDKVQMGDSLKGDIQLIFGFR